MSIENTVNAAFELDPNTRKARDRLVEQLKRVSSAEELWEVYRTTAIPAGAPLIQSVETQRAIFWTIAAMAQVLSIRPDALYTMVEEVREYGLSQLQKGIR
jgi:hypothetical protein